MTTTRSLVTATAKLLTHPCTDLCMVKSMLSPGRYTRLYPGRDVFSVEPELTLVSRQSKSPFPSSTRSTWSQQVNFDLSSFLVMMRKVAIDRTLRRVARFRQQLLDPLLTKSWVYTGTTLGGKQGPRVHSQVGLLKIHNEPHGLSIFNTLKPFNFQNHVFHSPEQKRGTFPGLPLGTHVLATKL